MNKKELKTGMVVEYRNGDLRLVAGNSLLDENGIVFNTLMSYHLDLISVDDKKFDIVAVYNSFDKSKCLWSRIEKIELSKEAKIILKCLPKEYKYITRDYDNEIWVHTNEPEFKIDLDDKEFWKSKGNEYLVFFDNLFEKLDSHICYKISDLIGDNDE